MPKLFERKKRPARNSSEEPEEFRAPLVDHLEELRQRIFRSIGFLAVAWIVGWFLEPFVYQTIDAMVRRSVSDRIEYTTAFTSLTEPFFFRLKLSLAIGILMALPFIIVQLWGFIKPGLRKHERRPVEIAAPVSIVLFMLGASVCWFAIPAALDWFARFLADYPDTVLLQKPQEIVFFIVKMMTAFGVGFQLPILVFVLGKIGLLGPESLSQYWRHAIVGIFFLTASITPSGDPVSLLMLALPLSILFVGSIYALRFTQRKEREREAAQEASNESF